MEEFEKKDIHAQESQEGLPLAPCPDADKDKKAMKKKSVGRELLSLLGYLAVVVPNTVLNWAKTLLLLL